MSNRSITKRSEAAMYAMMSIRDDEAVSDLETEVGDASMGLSVEPGQRQEPTASLVDNERRGSSNGEATDSNAREPFIAPPEKVPVDSKTVAHEQRPRHMYQKALWLIFG